MAVLKKVISKSHNFFTFVVLSISMSACSSFVPIENINGHYGKVNVSDKVRIQTVNGDRSSFIVSDISSTKISGDGKNTSVKDIVKLEKSEFSSMKTAGLTGLIVGNIFVNPLVGTIVFIGSYGVLKIFN